MHRPPLSPGMFLVLIFTRGWIDPRAMVRSEGNMSLKNPMTPPGVDPGTVHKSDIDLLNPYTTTDCQWDSSPATFVQVNRERTVSAWRRWIRCNRLVSVPRTSFSVCVGTEPVLMPERLINSMNNTLGTEWTALSPIKLAFLHLQWFCPADHVLPDNGKWARSLLRSAAVVWERHACDCWIKYVSHFDTSLFGLLFVATCEVHAPFGVQPLVYKFACTVS